MSGVNLHAVETGPAGPLRGGGELVDDGCDVVCVHLEIAGRAAAKPGTLVRVVCGDGATAGDVNRERIADAGLVLVGVNVAHVDRDLEPYAGSALAEPVLSPGGLLEEWCEAEGLEGDDMYAVLDKANVLLGWQ